MGNTVGSQRDFTKRQEEILLGMVLGDGCLEKNGHNVRLRVDHGLRQKAYLSWKFKEFKGLTTGKPRLVKGIAHPKTGKKYVRWHFSTFSLPEFNSYWEKFYPSKKKIIPNDIARIFKSPLSLVVWYMDDGYKRNDCKALRLNTDAFKYEEQKLLQKCLRCNFGIISKIHKKGKYWNIYIPSGESRKFCEIVKPYIIPQMRYKISLTP